jgi:hypothetical protein
MPSVSDYKAYHILSYGSFLGATLFQSFIGGVVAFKVLPRAQFSTLQKATFPVFFALQSVLGLALMVTYPGEKLLGVGNQYIRENVGFSGLLADSNRWSIFAPLATIFVTSVLNALIIGPATTRTMKERHHQGMLWQNLWSLLSSELTHVQRLVMARNTPTLARTPRQWSN